MSPARSIAASTPWSARKARTNSSSRRSTAPAPGRKSSIRADRANRQTEIRQAPELTPVFSAAAPVAGGSTLLVTDNDRGFTRTVRKQRRSLMVALGAVAALSVLLSLFLARTIVRPLRRIALRRASRPAGPGARGQRAAPAVAHRRDRPARPVDQRHEPVAAPPDRQYRSLRRRRDPRAQEPARLAALGGRRARAGRGSRRCASSWSTSSARTSSGSTG